MTISTHFKEIKSNNEGLGTFYGVFLPYLLSTFGVILYLRLGWIVGQFGIVLTGLSICLASLITFLTALSTSATATNMHMKGGGAYFILSRSFGVEFGAGIGVPLYISQAIGVAFCIEGFTEVLISFFPDLNPISVELGTLFLLTLIALGAAKTLLKLQPVILILVFLSLVTIFFESSPCSETSAKISTDPKIDFWTAFTFFFPAIACIESGLSFAENLNRPSRSLPLGILSAIATSLIVFLVLAYFLWWAFPKELLIHDPLILLHACNYQTPIFLSIFATTLFGAVGSLLNAPKTLEALAKDKIVPEIFSKTFGFHHEPRIAIGCTALFIGLVLFYTNINIIAPILTMFLLISYAMVNFASGLETLLGNPSWRPSFAVSSYLSLAGGIVTLFTMVMIDMSVTLLAAFCVIFFYSLAKTRPFIKKLDDIRNGLTFYLTQKSIYYLASQKESKRSWRPNMLLFSTSPTHNSRLIDFASTLTRDKGFLTTTAILAPQYSNPEKIASLKETLREFYKKNHIHSLVDVLIDSNLFNGMKRAISNTGLGPIVPNTIVFGECKNAYKNFSEVLKLTHELHKNAVIIRGIQKNVTARDATIEIWWDEGNRKNCNLMLVLAHMLQSSLKWKEHKVIIKCTAPNVQAKAMREAFFHTFLEKSRLSISWEVIFTKEPEISKTIALNSALADLVFLGLRPIEPEEEIISYATYLSSLLKKTEQLPFVAFTMSSEHLNLEEIFE